MDILRFKEFDKVNLISNNPSEFVGSEIKPTVASLLGIDPFAMGELLSSDSRSKQFLNASLCSMMSDSLNQIEADRKSAEHNASVANNVGLGTLVLGGAIGAVEGGTAGSVVPGLGTFIGAVGGFFTGMGAASAVAAPAMLGAASMQRDAAYSRLEQADETAAHDAKQFGATADVDKARAADTDAMKNLALNVAGFADLGIVVKAIQKAPELYQAFKAAKEADKGYFWSTLKEALKKNSEIGKQIQAAIEAANTQDKEKGLLGKLMACAKNRFENCELIKLNPEELKTLTTQLTSGDKSEQLAAIQQVIRVNKSDLADVVEPLQKLAETSESPEVRQAAAQALIQSATRNPKVKLAVFSTISQLANTKKISIDDDIRKFLTSVTDNTKKNRDAEPAMIEPEPARATASEVALGNANAIYDDLKNNNDHLNQVLSSISKGSGEDDTDKLLWILAQAHPDVRAKFLEDFLSKDETHAKTMLKKALADPASCGVEK